MVNYLVTCRVRFDVKDDCGYTAVDYARIYHPELKLDFASLDPKNQSRPVSQLPNTNQLQDFWGLTTVQYTVMVGDINQLEQLHTDGATFTCNSTDQTPLHLLCCLPENKNSVPIAALLL